MPEFYLALLNTQGIEPQGTYQRQPLELIQVGTTESWVNRDYIAFPFAASNWGMINRASITDQREGGEHFMFFELAKAHMVGSGDQLVLSPHSIRIDIIPDFMDVVRQENSGLPFDKDAKPLPTFSLSKLAPKKHLREEIPTFWDHLNGKNLV